MTSTPRLGKKPAQPARPQLRLTGTHLTGLPAPPESVDYGAGDYPMYGNDAYGDCVEAGVGHQVGQYTRYATGTEALFTDSDILNAYAQITGFRPGDPSTDQGTYTQDAMTWWRKTGLNGHKILLYASLELTDATALRQAVELFGAVGIGFNFPASAMQQFGAGQPWTVERGSPLEGGHYVIATGYDPEWLRTKTWGTEQRMAWSFLAAYADEAWVVITPEMANVATSATFSGIGLYALGQDFAALTGQANPIPPPAPAPTPGPEQVTPADLVLWGEREGWAENTHSLCARGARADLRTWASSKGLREPGSANGQR
jgi:hypothetical protein